ncbi:hypothetical protein N7471_010240 [Penicillium samsonianum]|uniref:uncharacterized protein n=1 Tax=Penicillium samsonianum TaxID=1882272 RepID=UPI00254980DC|nr:uncharacterized protein N7471_010240 [Penicillium samsonianum]KAJ6129023.1 hypothetical protein N7471_010240 [Penicillium samsonianum]
MDAIARIDATERPCALADASNSRPLLKWLLASVTATLWSIASVILTRSGSAAVVTQTDAPTSSDAMISNDTVEADATTPPVSRLHPPIPSVRVECEIPSDNQYDNRYDSPVYKIHVAPGSRILS